MAHDLPDLRTAELLLAVEEFGGIGAAARSLGLAQPNASRMLSVLEEQLSATLVARHPRGSTLTDAGIIAARSARQLLSAARRYTDVLESLAVDQRAKLGVAASNTVADHLIPAWLSAFQPATSGVDVSVWVRNSRQVFAEVEHGNVDLGFVETPETHPRLMSTVVARDELVIVVPPEHDWAAAGAVSLEQMRSAGLVTRESGSGTRLALEGTIGGDQTITSIVELGSNAAVRSTVLGGGGAAVLSELVVARDLERGDLVRIEADFIDPAAMRREIRAVWLPPAPTAHATAFIAAATAGSA